MRRDAGTSDSPSRRAPGRALLGGSFNPPHVGHLRLAIEVREALGGLVDMLDLVPCGNPPHKEPDSLLPFALAAAAGAMVYVVIEEVIPEANASGNGNAATVACIGGLCLVMSFSSLVG